MIDLKLSKKKKKELNGEVPTVSFDQEYPWGTSLTFEDEQLKKLNLSKVEAGDSISLSAIGKIVNISVYEKDKEKGRKSVEIQLQKIEITTEDGKKMRKQVAKEVWED